MTRPKNPDETTLLIKLPPDLKGSFQGLCKSRGVFVSEELRRFMADEVAKAALGMTTGDRNSVKKMPRKPRKPIDSTGELFSSTSDQQKSSIDAFNAKQVAKQQKELKSPTVDTLGLSSAISSAMNASNKRKKAKSSKK